MAHNYYGRHLPLTSQYGVGKIETNSIGQEKL